jgi:TolA-binding protein
MQKKYGKKGFYILAMSYEPPGTVAPYVKKQKMDYIVAGGASSTKDKYGIPGYPTAFIIDPDGKVAWTGHPSDPACEEAVKKVLKENPPKPGKGLVAGPTPKEMYTKAGKLYKQKKYAETLELLEDIVKEDEYTKLAKKAKKKIRMIKSNKEIMAEIRAAQMDKDCKKWRETAEDLVKVGKKDEAIEYYRKIVDAYPDSEHAKEATKRISELA